MKQVHELAEFFPPMEGEEYKALCADVKAYGLLNPIVLHEDKILDGRNRARACEDVGVRPKYETKTFTNGSAFEYVISQNVLRRHLTESQRAVLALELEERFAAEARARKNGPRNRSENRVEPTARVDLDKAGLTSRAKAAKALRIGPNLVQDAKRLARDYPEKIKAVRAGKISVTGALIEGRGTRARERMIRQKYTDKVKRLNKHSRQVADYLNATKAYIVALKVVQDDVDVFSPEAVRFVSRRHGDIRQLMVKLEEMLKAKA